LVVLETDRFKTHDFVFFHSSNALVFGEDGICFAILDDGILAVRSHGFDCVASKLFVSLGWPRYSNKTRTE